TQCKRHVRQADFVGALASPATGQEPDVRQARVAESSHLDGLADHVGVGRQPDVYAALCFELSEASHIVLRAMPGDSFHEGDVVCALWVSRDAAELRLRL